MVGKSVLTRVIYQTLLRSFSHHLKSNLDSIQMLLCAPTGKAAYNINGQTIHSAFCISVGQGLLHKTLAMAQLSSLRSKFGSLKVVFIDEISKLGNKMLNLINLRLQEIKGCQLPFGGVSIIAIGYLFQLKPVMDGWIFSQLQADYGPISANLWKDNFQMYELTEIMRQKNDHAFAQLLNRMREGIHTGIDLCSLNRRVFPLEKVPPTLPHLFTTNKEINEFNDVAFLRVDASKKTVIHAINIVCGDVSKELEIIIKEKVSNSFALPSIVKIGESLNCEICININVQDDIANGTPSCLVKKT